MKAREIFVESLRYSYPEHAQLDDEALINVTSAQASLNRFEVLASEIWAADDEKWIREVQQWWDQISPKQRIVYELLDEVFKSDVKTPSDEDAAIVIWAFSVLNEICK